MGSSHKLHDILAYIKTYIKYFFMGLLVIASVGIGFLIFAFAGIVAPFVRWWKRKKAEKKGDNVAKGDYIDADYEVIDDEKDKK